MTAGAGSALGFPDRIVVFSLLFVVACMAARTIFRRVSLIRRGRTAAAAEERIGEKIKRFLLYVPGQWSNVRDISWKDPGGLQHFVLFWGAILFSLYYLVFFFLAEGFGIPVLVREGLPARIFLPVTEIFGLLLIAALAWGLVRRAFLKPARLGPEYEGTLYLLIVLSASALLACFFSLEALRFDLKLTSYAGPVSGLLAGWFQGVPGGMDTLGRMFRAIWWIQGALIACFVVYVPYSTHQHAMFAPVNIFTSSRKPNGVVSPVEMNESYKGLSGLQDFTRKQLLEFYGCTQCGKCQDACPASAAGKDLSPKKILLDLRAWMDETGGIRPFWKGAAKHGEAGIGTASDRISDAELWSCTTCMACIQACPAFISPLDKIVDVRRDRVLARSRFFPEVANLFRDLEIFGDVFGKGKARREDWAVGRDIKVLSEENGTDTLFWMGCQATFDERSQRNAIRLVEVLTRAGEKLAILGKEELCCGDPLRRLGNEYQYQIFARRNIDYLRRLRFKRIVTYCPHCYNTLKNEYPQFGGSFEVVHYTELLESAIRGGKLSLKTPMAAKVAYHDPCYLARGNDVLKGREILDSLPGVKPLDVEHSGQKTFCCGGGGGAMWMRETGGAKINELRVKELTNGEADLIATSCPYCVVMLEDGIQSLGLENVKCKDLIEIVREMV